MKVIPLILLALIIANQTLAQSPIGKIVVTNSKYEQSLDELINFATVITRQEIEQIPASSAIDILNTVAGINVSSAGGKGTLTSVFLRGSNNSQTLVLVDGVLAAKTLGGEFSWENLDPDLIERIEIIRGAKATIYGSDARGVINIITRKAYKNSIKATYGSFGTTKGVVTAGAKHKNQRGIQATIVKEKSSGFSRTNSKNTNDFDSDDDSFHNESVNIRAFIKPKNNLELSTVMLKQKIQAETDTGVGFPTVPDTSYDKTESDKSMVSLRLKHDYNDFWGYSLHIAETKQENINLPASTFTDTNAERYQGNFSNYFRFKNQKIIIGKDKIQSKELEKDDSQLVEDAYFVNWFGKWSKLNYEFGFRKTKHNIFGDYGTEQYGLAYSFTDKLKIKSTLGHSKKVPSNIELNGSVYVTANKDLQPETSETRDLSLVFNSKLHNHEISYYQTKILDPITWISSTSSYYNGQATDFNGLDLASSLIFDDTLLKASYTWLDYQDEDKEDVARRPNKFNFNLVHKIKFNQKFGLNLLAVGKARDGNKELDEFVVVNTNYKYKVNKSWSLELKIENLNDADYQTVYGYNTAQRSYYLTAEYQIK